MPLKFKIAGASFGTLILFVILIVVSLQSLTTMQETNTWVEETFRVISSGRKLERLVADLSAGKQGYEITRSKEFAIAYLKTRSELAAEIVDLRRIVRDRGQVDRLVKLSRSLDQWGKEIADAELDTGGGGRRPLAHSPAEDRSAKLIQEMRQELRLFLDDESKLLTARQAEASRMVLRTWNIIVWGTLGVMVISILMAILLARSIVRRVDALVDSVRSVAAGDLSLRMRVNSGDEIGNLATSFNEMIVSLQAAKDKAKQDEEEKRRLQKMESIGQLAAGIAHEINTPTQYVGDNTRFLRTAFQDLGPVFHTAQALLESLASDPRPDPAQVEALRAALDDADISYLEEEIPGAIDGALEGIARVTKIVKAMNEFAHPGNEVKEPADLNHAVQNTVTLATNAWRYVADLETDLDPTLPAVPCLAGGLKQVILNLIVNAAHAVGDVVGDGSDGKGKIRVSTKLVGAYAEIRIADTGPGIPEAVRERIFDPFFTTKEPGKGSGQGLSIAHSVVVQQHGGELAFESELGQGTTFIIRLPLIASTVSSARVPAVKPSKGRPQGAPAL